MINKCQKKIVKNQLVELHLQSINLIFVDSLMSPLTASLSPVQRCIFIHHLQMKIILFVLILDNFLNCPGWKHRETSLVVKRGWSLRSEMKPSTFNSRHDLQVIADTVSYLSFLSLTPHTDIVAHTCDKLMVSYGERFN